MSTTGTILHRTVITGINNPASQVSKNVWNDTMVVASAAPNGAVMVRDSAQSDGWGFSPDISGVYNVKADGAVGDGTTDDTVAIQTTLNRFSNGVIATGSGHIYVPTPSSFYKITAPLLYGGNSSHGLRIEGDIGGGKGPTGSCIKWYGPTGGTMFIAAGANGFLMENIELDGREVARRGAHFTATHHITTTLGTVVTPGTREVTPGAMTNIAIGTLLNVDTGVNLEYVYVTAVTGATFTAIFVKSHGTSAVVGGGHPSSEMVLRRMTVIGCVGAGSGALVFGNPTSGTTPQISEVDMYDLHLRGSYTPGLAEAGILTVSPGNTKNYKVHGGWMGYFNYGLDMQQQGTLLIDGTVFGGMALADVKVGPASYTHIQSVESEGTGYMFVTGSVSTNPGSVTIVNCNWQGITDADDIMIDYPGNLTLIGNSFYNWRTAGAVTKIRSDAQFADTDPATIFSQGNWWLNAPAGFIPIINSSSVDVFTLGNQLLSITSLGDYGGYPGTLIKLTNFIPNAVVGGMTLANATNIVLNATTGTKIGTATTQKLGFYNATPVVQGASVADATDAATAITQLNALISRLEATGLIATV